jgi:ABC-type uncharacterized transport system involved in gliding motility auxiliary subunit
MTNKMNKNSSASGLLWAALVALLLGMLFARAVYPELLWLTIVIAVPLVAVMGLLIQQNSNALRGRTAAYGLNSAITVLLVLGIVGVLNFLGSRYPQKLDLTKNKVHTLSDQTIKVVKGLQKPVKAVFFSNLQQREQFRPLLEDYKGLNPKFELEYVNPDREPTRAKQASIKKYGTLQLLSGTRDNKIEEPTEEKLTNALIKLLKDKTPTLCAVTGHGEKNFSGQDAEGFDTAKKGLTAQSYEVKDLNLIQEAKIPDTCDAIAILGPTKAYFAPELKLIGDYLDNGGRAIVALDVNVKGGAEFAPELTALLKDWNVKVNEAMIVDPLSKMLGVDASVPILASFSKESPITRDFTTNCYFPFARPLDVIPGAPSGLKVEWIAQTTPKSWAVTDMTALATGQVKFTEGKDRTGPLSAAIAVDGKRAPSKSPRNTRLVVFGTSHFATNNYSRFGGNIDFFLNSVSWVMEDESLISIRSKEEGPGKVELSNKQGTVIFLLTVFVIPLLTAIAGVVIWVMRRRL